jgi:hypothetical protein
MQINPVNPTPTGGETAAQNQARGGQGSEAGTRTRPDGSRPAVTDPEGGSRVSAPRASSEGQGAANGGAPGEEGEGGSLLDLFA